MTLKEVVSECVQYCRIAVVGATVSQFALGGMFAPSLQAQETPKTASPIKHVIIIVGENRTFDHVFATYKPTNGQTVDNLLSRKIINADGTPGPNFSEAGQFDADDFHQDKFQISPEKDAVYPTLPPPLTGGPNPKPTKGNAYVPANSPAIGDLFDLFDFSKKLQGND